jgi:methyl-accepting chemotaxis protein
MLANMKIGARLFGGFAIILLLVCLMAVVSLGGSNLVSQGIDDGERINGLVAPIQSVRLAQAEYTANPEKSSPGKVREQLSGLMEKARETRQAFASQADQERLDQVIELAGKYLDQFNQFVELEEKKRQMASEMTASGDSALKTSRSVTEEQNHQLLKAKQDNLQMLKDTNDYAERANRAIASIMSSINFSDRLRYEKTEDAVSTWENELDTLNIMLKLMGEKLKNTRFQKDVEQINKQAKDYEDAVRAFAKGTIGFDTVATVGTKLRELSSRLFEAMQADVRSMIKAFDMFLDEKMALAGEAEHITNLLMEARQAVSLFRLTGESAAYQEAANKLRQIIKTAKDSAEKRRKPEEAKQMNDLAASVGSYLNALDQYVAFTGQQTSARAAMQTAAQEAEEACRQTWSAQKGSMDTAVQGVNLTLLLVAAACVSLGMILAWLITRGITKPLRKVIEGLRSGYARVSQASQDITNSSASVAESSSRQAASLEETAASMEEMSTVIQNNAENASQADGLMRRTKDIVLEADQSLASLKSAMEQIVEASDETAKINKTIDEIAFQTNLLALNAAVEAARAGEAGAGFAVVADEVRSLAMRAAEAAKNTASLIDNNLQNIKQGADILHNTEESFDQLRESAEKTSSLVNEIALSSRQQAEGIDQVNQALNQMDHDTQRTAAMAQESSGAADELTSEEMLMEQYVEDLVKLVGMGRNGARQELPQPKALLPQTVQEEEELNWES